MHVCTFSFLLSLLVTDDSLLRRDGGELTTGAGGDIGAGGGSGTATGSSTASGASSLTLGERFCFLAALF